MTEVLFLPAAVKDLKKVPREIRQWVREVTVKLAEDPFIGTKSKALVEGFTASSFARETTSSCTVTLSVRT